MTKNYWEWDPIFTIDPDTTALLIIDMQNGFLEEGSPLEVPMARKQVPVINSLKSYCRKLNIPVIFTAFYVGPDSHYDFYWKMAKQRGLKLEEPNCEFWIGKHETEIFPDLKPLPNETVINKYGYDCFAGTNLDDILRSQGVTNLLVTGTVLNWCVDSTVRAAYHKHYNVTVISDAVSSYDHAGGTAEEWCKMELNLFAEAFGRVLTSEEAINEMEGSHRDKYKNLTS